MALFNFATGSKLKSGAPFVNDTLHFGALVAYLRLIWDELP
jgi:hypothetical protein